MFVRLILPTVVVAALAIAVSLNFGNFGAYMVYVVAIAGIGALSLNLLTGFCGQINFAQAGLLGVGAYAAGLAGNAGWDVFALLVGGVAAVFASVLIGLPALRLRGLYFAIATLAAQVILEYLFKFAEPITHGVSGLLIKPMTLLGKPVLTDQGYAVVSIVVLLVTYLIMVWLRRTDLGRAFLIIRENEVVAKGMGVNVARTKMLAFMISGFFAGVTGALIGFTTRIAHPESFGMVLSVDYVAMIIVGGLGSLPGAILGAGFITLLPEVIQRIGEMFNIADLLAALREIAFGLLIIIFLIFEPKGLSAIVPRINPSRLFQRRSVDRFALEANTQLEKVK